MPQVGESVVEAVIGKWLKSPGDRVEKFEPLVEMITDKVAMDMPAPVAGTLTRIVVPEGKTVPIGTVIAEVDADGASVDDPTQAPTPETRESPPARACRPLRAGRRSGEALSMRVAPADRVGSMISGANVGPTGGAFTDVSLDASPAEPPAASPRSAEPSLAGKLSPAVRALCERHGIDAAALAGTGVGNRVTRRDVQRALANAAPSAARTHDSAAARVERTVVPSPVRSMIAAHVSRSFREIPHAWSAVEVDVTGLVACRSAQLRRDAGLHLTYLPFALREVAAALRANPLLNSSWRDETIVLYADVNVGIAVAGKDGLVVPVVRNADAKSLLELARDLAKLVANARGGTLGIDDVRGGTFTLNNTGALGSVWGGAIINHPQTAILTTEAIVKRPVVVGAPGAEAVEVRSMMNVCLSFDHRVIDGAEAGAFLQDVKRRLEAISADTHVE